MLIIVSDIFPFLILCYVLLLANIKKIFGKEIVLVACAEVYIYLQLRRGIKNFFKNQ